MINIRFFGQLRERLTTESIELVCDVPISVGDIKNELFMKSDAFSVHLAQPNVLVAVNHEYATVDTLVNDGDEVAFFPPVTGG